MAGSSARTNSVGNLFLNDRRHEQKAPQDRNKASWARNIFNSAASQVAVSFNVHGRRILLLKLNQSERILLISKKRTSLLF